jgi:hypothetical protein
MITLPVYARTDGSATGVAAATTTLTVKVLEAAGGTGADIAIEYSPAASVDNEESIFYSVPESSPGVGTLYVEVTPDVGSNAVIARLDIEKVA